MSTESTYEIGIIGAGVHGASAAYHLARQGVSTVVFERGLPASGPTGRSSGLVRSYYTNPFLAEVARDSTRFLAAFGEHTDGADSGYRRTGGLYLHGASDVADVRAAAAGLTHLGIENSVLESPELGRRFPGLVLDDVAIGIWEAEAGYADPYGTATGLLAAARRHGADVRTNARVIAIEEQAGAVRIRLADGVEQSVQRLLVAAGPWTGALLKLVGVHVPLTAERHIVTGLALPGGGVFDHILIDVAGGYYSRPGESGESGQFLLGPLAPTEPTDPDLEPAAVTDLEFAWLAQQSIARIPARGAATAATRWSSLYDVSPDWQPVIGQVSDHVFVDAGTSGHGFKLAPGLGEHVARLVLGNPDPRLTQFAPDRFAAGAGLASGFGVARILG